MMFEFLNRIFGVRRQQHTAEIEQWMDTEEQKQMHEVRARLDRLREQLPALERSEGDQREENAR